MKERRRFVRLNAQVDIAYSKVDTQNKENLSLTKNISAGGICLICYEPVRVKDMLDLKIILPVSQEPIKVLGRVVWVKEFIVGGPERGKRYDAGIEFVEINDGDRKQIEQFIFSVMR